MKITDVRIFYGASIYHKRPVCRLQLAPDSPTEVLTKPISPLLLKNASHLTRQLGVLPGNKPLETINIGEMLLSLIHAITLNLGEIINFSKVLRTFILNSEVKAEVSSGGSSTSKISGIIDWIGERKDGDKGIELFLRSRSGNKVFILGENVEQASYNGSKRSLSISETPETCPICKSGISAKDATIQCPSCSVKAHKDHFLY